MRELTIDEHDVVSGGVGGQNYPNTNPGSDRIVVTGSLNGNFFNNISLGFGSGVGIEGLSAAINFDLSKLPSLPEGPVNPLPPTDVKPSGKIPITDNIDVRGAKITAPEGAYYGFQANVRFR